MSIIKKILLLISILIIGGVCYSYVIFNFTEYDDSGFKIEKANLVYFQETYNECRQKFRILGNQLRMLNKDVRVRAISVNSAIDQELTIDSIYLPAQEKKEKLIIISSGVHGVEGFVGSAVQQMFITEMIPRIDLNTTGVLLIHAINPYGMKYNRRVTENNVDLNRNSDVNPDLFSLKNDGYSELNDFLNPKTKLDINSISNRFFMLNVIIKIVQKSMKALRQAVLQGQYQFEKGIFFGGKKSEPQIEDLKPFIKTIAAPYEMTMAIDLHSGFGERGKLHLFLNPIKDKVKKSKIEHIFEGTHIDWGDGDDFYTVTGDFVGMVEKTLPPGKFLPVVFEYGTMDSQTTTGSIKSLHIMITENQGIHYGYATAEDKKEISKRIKNMYFPSSPLWRSEVIRITRELLTKTIDRF